MKSLRGQLLLFWFLLVAFCVAVAVLMVTLYRSSAGVQMSAARAATASSCGDIAQRYAVSIASPVPAVPQVDLLQVLLRLVLIENPYLEGGVWQASGGFLAYAYPTYEGGGVKEDVPSAEQPLIIELSRRAARTQQAQIDVVRGTRDAIVISTCPLASPHSDLVAWTMTRTHVDTLVARGNLYIGLGVLLAIVLGSGVWLGVLLLRGVAHVEKLEGRLADASDEQVPKLPRTGLRELDRLVDSFNRFGVRLEEARTALREAARQHSRDQRLASLGRMTGGIAHEIRNPIAAMRLKAENALAAPPERQGEALRAIVGQVDRLEGLVRSLLALVQPVVLAPREVDLKGWLEERRSAFSAQAAARNVSIQVSQGGAAMVVFDPIHLARAIDNLMDNAVRSAQPGGTVTLEASAVPGRALTIAVEDDGSGVPEQLLPQLFEPFATLQTGGTGLGLAMAREVALAHGGELRHRALQNGARFELEIPWRVC